MPVKGLEYRLPVVIENGTIKASIADVVCTEGTMLNERMQDFLLAIDAYSAACTDKPVEQIQSGSRNYIKRYIEMNNEQCNWYLYSDSLPVITIIR